MDYRKIITFYYMKKCVILSYVTGKAFQDLTTFAGTTETPGNVAAWMECRKLS